MENLIYFLSFFSFLLFLAVFSANVIATGTSTTTSTYTCFDPDGGLNYSYKSSIVSKVGNVWWDQCSQENNGVSQSSVYCTGPNCFLYESLCSPVNDPSIIQIVQTFDGAYSTKTNCPNGCQDGTCVTSCTSADIDASGPFIWGGKWRINADVGSDDVWSRIAITPYNSSGSTYYQIIAQGDSWNFTNFGFSVYANRVNAYDNGSIYTVNIVVSPLGFVCAKSNKSYFTLNFSSGWNMFSLPVFPTSTIQDTCTRTSPIWHYNIQTGQYDQMSDIRQTRIGWSYWLKVQNNCSMTFYGVPISISNFALLTPGWNQIASPSQSISFPAGNCTLVSGPWKYNPQTNQYDKSQTLDTGFGYWVKVQNNCKLG